MEEQPGSWRSQDRGDSIEAEDGGTVIEVCRLEEGRRGSP